MTLGKRGPSLFKMNDLRRMIGAAFDSGATKVEVKVGEMLITAERSSYERPPGRRRKKIAANGAAAPELETCGAQGMSPSEVNGSADAHLAALKRSTWVT